MSRGFAGKPSGRSKASRRAGANARPPLAEPGPKKPTSNRLRVAGLCALLALVVWAVFGQTVRHSFLNFDDDLTVYENVNVSRGLSWNGVAWAFTQSHAANWHPLTSLSHMLACELFGLNAGGHHGFNVFLHSIAAILLFLTLRSLTGAFWRSAFVAAVFAVHPLRVESVAWVTERKDVLSGCFFMLTLWAYARYAQAITEIRNPKSEGCPPPLAPRPLSPLLYFLALVFFTLGLMSKPMLVTLPFVLLLLDYWPLNRVPGVKCQVSGADTRLDNLTPRTSLLALLVEKVPFFLLAAGSCAMTVWAARHSLEPMEGLSLPWRLGNAVVAYATYLGQTFYPAGLVVLYPHLGSQLPLWQIVVSLVVMLAVSAGAIAGGRQRPYLLVGWLWYMGMLVPVIGLVQVGNQAHADRFTYLPQIGLAVMVVWGAADLCASWRYRRAVLRLAGGGVLAVFAVAAYVQTTHWRDNVALWTRTLDHTSGNFIAHNNLGNALAESGKVEEAVFHYEQAIRLKPGDAEAYTNLANRLAEQGKFDEAIPLYEHALRLNPDYANAHYNLGVTRAARNDLAEAVQHYEQTLRLKPDHVNACVNLGNVFIRQGRFAEAVRSYERALALKPDFAEVHFNLGNAWLRQDRWAEAIPHYSRALRLRPAYVAARYNLGLVLSHLGRLDDARQQFQQALDLATAQGDTTGADAIRARLDSSHFDPPQPQ